MEKHKQTNLLHAGESFCIRNGEIPTYNFRTGCTHKPTNTLQVKNLVSRMKTRRSAANAAGGNGHSTQKRKYIRQPKNKQQETIQPTVLSDDGPREEMQVSIPTDKYLDGEAATAEVPPNIRSPIAEQRPDDGVENKPKLEECNQLVDGNGTASDSLILLAGCLNSIKYEVIDFENQGQKRHFEAQENEGLDTLSGKPTMLQPHDEVEQESITPPSKMADSAATCAIETKPEKLANSQSNKKASSSFNGAFKLYRFMICEWFYSHIDRPLFAEGYNKKLDLGALLKPHFPSLFTRSLNRAQWNFVRMLLRKERPVRRLSRAFFLQERINLERRREKLRFLMENSMIEYLDDDIPPTIPKPIDIGSAVRSTSFVPHYGSYSGETVGVENLEVPYFRIRFTNGDNSASEQLLPDYRVAMEQSFHIADGSDTVSVPIKHLKQIALLEGNLNEKIRLLQALENIRLNMAARHVLGTLNTDQNRDQIERYDQTVRKVLNLNRTLMQLLKQVTADYEQHMSEPLIVAGNAENVPVVDRYVVEVADQLLAAYAQLDNVHINPAADRLWKKTMQRLRRRPEYLEQFEAYLASNVGTLFNAFTHTTTHESR
uniref:DIRP domain-containing protein n=1 Tax=Anopheles maculatus TaxID=74869 RepID=A0A182T782_9DIPT